MYRISISLLIIILPFIISCDVRDQRLIIKNSCNSTICFVITNKELDVLFNHASFSLKGNLSQNRYPQREAHREYPEPGSISGGYKYWSYFVEESSDKKMRIYVYDEKTLRENDWENVIANKMYIKYIILSFDELEKLNWTIDICSR